jgi:hypothetical protein
MISLTGGLCLENSNKPPVHIETKIGKSSEFLEFKFPVLVSKFPVP